MARRWWIGVGALLVVYGCGRNEKTGVSPSNGDPAGESTLGEGDAGFTPSVRAVSPPACPKAEQCEHVGNPFSLVHETPANIELREAQGRTVLAFDSVAHAFVAYEAGASSDRERLDIHELLRFDSRYDRVRLDRFTWALACQGSACDLVSSEPGRSAVHVPDELHAAAIDRGCVAGTGIACLEGTNKVWNWIVPPEAFERPIVALAQLVEKVFVASDGQGKPFIVDRGHIAPLDVGAPEPIVSLAAGWNYTPQWWVGRAASGRLVLGSYGGGTTCDTNVDLATVDYTFGLFSKQGDGLLNGFMGCRRSALPPGMIGMGATACGISVTPFVFDAHRVYATPFSCWFD